MGNFYTSIGTAIEPVTSKIIGYYRVRKEWPPRADGHFSTPFVRIANVKSLKNEWSTHERMQLLRGTLGAKM